MEEETVMLEIEGTGVECNKNMLIRNSDYFSAMFTGSFKESSLKKVQIQNVDLKSFNTILMLLCDETYVIDAQEIHLILQAACMLQFNHIKQLCESRIQEILNPSICIQIWKTAELLDVYPLWLKAKSMALQDFCNICDSNQILELSIDDVCSYLGHIYLSVKNELTVFQTAMNWWYENQKVYYQEDCTKLILTLFNCIDFKALKDNEIKEMQSYPEITNNAEIISILNCIIDLKNNGINVGSAFSEKQLMYAIHFCNSKSRITPKVPCVLLQSDWKGNSCPNKKFKCSKINDKNVIIYDRFLRKRILVNLERSRHDTFFCNADLSSILYDPFSKEFKNVFLIGGEKVKDLIGFKLLSYKEFVFLYGGEYLIGGGNWNCNFWMYDTFKEKWERKNMMPHGRRHFETVMVDGCIYIIGGIGKFRVFQENLLWYDFKADNWSPVTSLPLEERNFKSCSFCEQLFVVFWAERRGYFFNKELITWTMVNLIIEKEIVNEMEDFMVLSDKNFLYVKGKYLIKFMFDGEKLNVVKQIPMKDVEYEEIDSVLCNNVIYTLYKGLDDDYNFFYTFESFNLDTEELRYIFKNKIQEKDTIQVEDKLFCPTQYTKVFLFRYYCLVKEDVCVNTPFFE